MKSLHRKKEIEQKERENEIFHLERNYDIAKHESYTIPVPYKLSKVNF